MTQAQRKLLDRLSVQPASPALRQIREMALDSSTVNIGSEPVVGPAHEVLSVWSIRLWNATLRARRFVGLADLVRGLMKLSPDEKVEQIALKNGSKTGLVFFEAETRQPIGAVISVHADADVRRSHRNLEEAMNTQFPVLSTKPSAR